MQAFPLTAQFSGFPFRREFGHTNYWTVQLLSKNGRLSIVLLHGDFMPVK
jgi:hypothetical protein